MARGRNTNRIAAHLAEQASPTKPLEEQEAFFGSSLWDPAELESDARISKAERRLRSGQVKGLGWVKIVERTDGHIRALVRDADGEFEAIERIDDQGELHSPSGDVPSWETSRGEKRFHRHGYPHRAGDKPAVILPDGTELWFQSGLLHRDVGAAVSKVGYCRYVVHGENHRYDGPAEIWFDEASGMVKRAKWWFEGRECRHQVEFEMVRANSVRE